MCAVPNIAVFCSSLTSWFPGIVLTCFLNDFEIIIIIIIIIIQLVQMLGEGDEELVPEHLLLQDKLHELQYKKQHMDHLVAEFQTLHNHPSLTTGK
jgi:energy-converting hydrogenase Eha subunit H